MKEDILKKIQQDLYEIFGDTDISTLSDYDKRNMIFDYLVKEVSYDWKLYLKLLYVSIAKTKNIPSKRINRSFEDEFEKIVLEHNGVCNAISTYYKVLLGEVGIDSIVIGTRDDTPVSHVLNLVYNSDSDTYSFDDVTSKITRKRSKDKCFDYDIEDANSIKQGLRSIVMHHNTCWVPIPPLGAHISNNIKHFSDIENKISSLKKQSSQR